MGYGRQGGRGERKRKAKSEKRKAKSEKLKREEGVSEGKWLKSKRKRKSRCKVSVLVRNTEVAGVEESGRGGGERKARSGREKVKREEGVSK